MAPPRLLIAVLTAACMGCASVGDTFHVTAFLHEQITGDTWRACLAREYQTQTRLILRESRDWAAASQLSGKGWAALNDGSVAPSSPADFDLEPSWRAPFDAANAELGAGLVNKSAAPCLCARAQAAFDGWLAASVRPAANANAAQGDYVNALAACRQAEVARVEAR